MREWIPVSTSPKGRLALAAVREFGSRPFGDVGVGELAAAAGVTTGALYHHFGSKLGLYLFVREDVERRLLDRIEGALDATGSADADGARADLPGALLVGFDFAVRSALLHLLDEPPTGAGRDGLADLLAERTASDVLGRVIAAAWRAALAAVAEGASPERAREALSAIGLGLAA